METTGPAEAFSTRTIIFGNGVQGEPFVFESGNPATYARAIADPATRAGVRVHGLLFRPKGEGGPAPAVILTPGSLGVAPSHLAHAETLNALGAAVLVIDPFGARGVTSTVANQAQYAFAASALDVVCAASALARTPGVDPGRIGAQGHSRGGSAVITAAMRAFAGPIGGADAGLRAVYAAYPWCGHQFDDPDPGATEIRAVIGTRDDWCSPAQVQAFIHAVRLRGGRASFRLFDNAAHSFDRATPLEVIPDAAVSPQAPTVYLAADGAMVHPLTGEADPGLTDRDLMVWALKAGYGVRGATIGGGAGLADAFRADMSAFWIRALGLGGSADSGA